MTSRTRRRLVRLGRYWPEIAAVVAGVGCLWIAVAMGAAR